MDILVHPCIVNFGLSCGGCTVVNLPKPCDDTGLILVTKLCFLRATSLKFEASSTYHFIESGKCNRLHQVETLCIIMALLLRELSSCRLFWSDQSFKNWLCPSWHGMAESIWTRPSPSGDKPNSAESSCQVLTNSLCNSSFPTNPQALLKFPRPFIIFHLDKSPIPFFSTDPLSNLIVKNLSNLKPKPLYKPSFDP